MLPLDRVVDERDPELSARRLAARQHRRVEEQGTPTVVGDRPDPSPTDGPRRATSGHQAIGAHGHPPKSGNQEGDGALEPHGQDNNLSAVSGRA